MKSQDVTPAEVVAELPPVVDPSPVLPLVPVEPTYADDEPVAVMHGPYTGSPRDRHNIDGYDFVGGVCRRVPYGLARKWQKSGKVKIIILPVDATEADFLRHSGVSRLKTDKLVAQLLAADLDEVYKELGPDRAALIAEGLARRLTRTSR